MARIIVAQFITLDGVVEDPDGSGGTPFGGWCFRHGPEAISGDKFRYGSILQTGIFLFGRRTWEAFSALWPPRDETDPFAHALNAADKAVVTRGDVDLSRWRNSRRVDADPVGWARETAAERDVIVIGSGSLVERFVEEGAVDEYRLRVFPTATGAGRRLFPDGAALDLVSVEQMGPTSLMIATPSVRDR
ncbi:MAG: dihydrofolate reductase family protein [Microbacterium sp.]|jgi:dihydrofolate reductase|uniref:dihydrofolate reductase family protein n=1 Tax=Microbacterium sp. TaxID=51671 RepID=UPI002826F482|nr:dihydrofolate reductase family protein [Microbacterium sp.]MDR2320136.1 dihydrofolate reductase family protein [Microbacterium sp.]